MLAAGSALAAEQWMTGDWHQHSWFTDSTNFMGDVDMNTPANPIILNGPSVTDPKATFATGTYKGVIPQGFRYGLNFQANSEHGGNRGSHDAFGRFWDDTNFYGTTPAASIPLLGTVATYSSACSYLTTDSPSCSAGSHQVMWRWQELIAGSTFGTYMSAFDWITTLRGQYPETGSKYIMTGMEWNVPGHEHASTGCLENNGKCIAEFEYRFDQTDTDATGATSPQSIAAGINWTGKIQTSFYTTANGYPDYSATLGLKPLHAKSIEGLKWANDNHPNTMWINPGHIERAGCGTATDSGYSIAALRDMNNTAPSVFFGFEGMPGHQKASNRGEISATSCGGGTYGGAGTYIATVGGVWDNLLADGRKIYNFVSSDFHITRDDFYPGEYAKTYIKTKDTTTPGNFTQQDILNGMRSGNSYAVHGDLITDLDYKVIFKTPYGNKSATMGETLPLKAGNKVTVQIRFKDGSTNNNGDVATVHHVQLIQGTMNPAGRASKFNADGTPNTAFNTVNPAVATVVGTFDNDSTSTNPKWTVDAQGYKTITYTTTVQNDTFFRIRGTNLGYNVTDPAFGTDAAGNPLKNVPGTNSVTAAWKDLWFYSNPVFVTTTAPTQFVYTSDSHYGITRSAIANGATAAQPVNQALVATINALPAKTTPCDGGVNACATAVNSIDFVANTGDVANRQETGIQSAAASWAQFNTDYILGLNVKNASGTKAPLYLVPGNHDVSNAVGYYKTLTPAFDATSYVNIYNLMLKPSTPLTNAGFIGASAADAAVSYAANKVNYSRNIGGVHFIFLTMWPDSAARTWMESDLNSVSSTTPVVLFTHDQPDIETKHLMNPNVTRNHTINSTDKFENLVLGEATGGYASVAAITGTSDVEQAALTDWLRPRKNIVAYFHGNSNWNQFYAWPGRTAAGQPDGISLNTFRVDSPMKGEASKTDLTNLGSTVDPNRLSYQVISIDPAATQMTVREYRWNTKTWGDAKTVSLAPRAN
jgi:hypothetical protein